MLIDYKKANVYQQDGTPVLHDVDFHVDEGEFIYIIGRVGSGKSSLLKTLYFELDLNEAENAFVLKATGWKDKQKIEERINDVLEDVELQDYANRYPHELSGGEQQRVAIARSMLNYPKIIIADEPTGNLDPETAAHIVSLLRQVTQSGTAVVMTTHNIPLLDEYPGIVYRCIDHRLEDITNDYNKMALAEEEEASAQQVVDYSAREDLSM